MILKLNLATFLIIVAITWKKLPLLFIGFIQYAIQSRK